MSFLLFYITKGLLTFKLIMYEQAYRKKIIFEGGKRVVVIAA